jgi:hypothetical protein
MALEGSLRDFDLFSLFTMIQAQGQSGTLVLSRSQESVKVRFGRGEIIGCDASPVPLEDRVGATLARLAGADLQTLLQGQRQTLRPIATLLLEAGRVTPQEVQDALLTQAMTILYRAFRWVEGDYRFDSVRVPEPGRAAFAPIPVENVLMEAARILDEWPGVQRRLPDLRLPLAWTSAGKQPRPGLGPERETVLSYFSMPAGIQAVLSFSRFQELETCRMIADLLEAGLLEAAEPAPEWRKPIEPLAPPVPSRWFWPVLGFLLSASLVFHGSRPGPSLRWRASLWPDPPAAVREDTRDRQAWAFTLAAPGDGGRALARSLGVRLAPVRPIPDFSRQPDPLTP